MLLGDSETAGDRDAAAADVGYCAVEVDVAVMKAGPNRLRECLNRALRSISEPSESYPHRRGWILLNNSNGLYDSVIYDLNSPCGIASLAVYFAAQ
jgi:hypothetical protein